MGWFEFAFHDTIAIVFNQFLGTNSSRMFLAIWILFCEMLRARIMASRWNPSASNWSVCLSVTLSQLPLDSRFSLLHSWFSRSLRTGSGAFCRSAPSTCFLSTQQWCYYTSNEKCKLHLQKILKLVIMYSHWVVSYTSIHEINYNFVVHWINNY